MLPPSPAASRVQVRLTVRDVEKVRVISEEQEEVEVDGFTFRRKRRRPATPPADISASTGNSDVAGCDCTQEQSLGDCQVQTDAQQCTETAAEEGMPSSDIAPLTKLQPIGVHVPADLAMVEALLLRELLGEGYLDKQTCEKVCSHACGWLAKTSGCDYIPAMQPTRVDASAAILKQYLGELTKQQEAWESMITKSTSALTVAAKKRPEPSDLPGVALRGATSLAVARASGSITLQADALSSMVEGLEDLARKADEICNQLQAEYHQDKFSVFAHVNSPAWLIKQLVGGQRHDQD